MNNKIKAICFLIRNPQTNLTMFIATNNLWVLISDLLTQPGKLQMMPMKTIFYLVLEPNLELKKRLVYVEEMFEDRRKKLMVMVGNFPSG